MEAGFLASVNGFGGQAIAIFEGVCAARTDSELADVDLSFGHLTAGNVGESLKVLERALQKNPESHIAKTFVGLCLKCAGQNSEGDEVLTSVGEDDAADPLARDLATALLQEKFEV